MKRLKWLMLPVSIAVLTMASCDNEDCGNGTIDGVEECDDGNAIDNDGCTNICTLPVCGDGIINQAAEECDDGNDVAGDGCESDCTVTNAIKCGNGVLEAGETCDDGNVVDGDGCESDCTITLNFCSNGIIEAGETCDDGNLNNGDGCDENCDLESETVNFAQDNLGLAIPDDTYDGTLASMACVNIDVPDDGYNTTFGVEVEMGITHTWVGDLVIKLVDPSDTVTLTLMSRPGFAEPADDGTGVSQESSNLDAANNLTFHDGIGTSAEAMGATLNNNEVVCADDGFCMYTPAPGQGPGISFNDFTGLSSVGTWKFCVGDSGAIDTGTIESVNLILTKLFTL